MDRLTELSVFIAAVEDGSLAAAGRRVGMTPAMAGKYVAALEAELGIRLLHRNTRKLSLTDVGRTYFERSKRILEEMEEADREARNLHSPRESPAMTFGAVRFGAPIARFVLPSAATQLIENCSAKCPKLPFPTTPIWWLGRESIGDNSACSCRQFAVLMRLVFRDGQAPAAVRPVPVCRCSQGSPRHRRSRSSDR